MRQKTETRQVYNEELGCYEWKEVETDKYVPLALVLSEFG